MALFVAIMAIFHIAESLRARNGTLLDHPTGDSSPSDAVYTFEMFVQEFGRTYVPGSEEYVRRAALFQDSSSRISFENSHADRSWTAGVHPFMDWTVAERQGLFGYKPFSHRGAGRPLLASAQEVVNVAHDGSVYGELGKVLKQRAPKSATKGHIAAVAGHSRLWRPWKPNSKKLTLLGATDSSRHRQCLIV